MVKAKVLFMIAAGTAMALMALGVASAAPAPKVDVCHMEGNGSFHLINVSENALPAHLAHGDGLPGQAVPEREHYVFGDDCGTEFVPFLLATVDVSGQSNTPTTNGPTLENEVEYELRVTGTYSYGPGLADAQCSFRPVSIPFGTGDWVNGDALIGHENWLEVNYADGSAIDWSPGTCDDAGHAYTASVTGDGSAINFLIQDDIYNDNSVGDIAVAIWQMSPSP